MECEIQLIRKFDYLSAEGRIMNAPELNFILGIQSKFYHNGNIIEEDEYNTGLEQLKISDAELPIKDKIELLWSVFKQSLRTKLKYIKLKEDNMTYTYRGHKMLEM